MTGAGERSPNALRPPLIGRDDELAQLVAITEAPSAHARVVLVEGEPGVGKTRLLDAAVEAVPGGVSVLRARGFEHEREHPFGAIAEALQAAPEVTAAGRQAVFGLLDTTAPAPEGDAPTLRFRVAEAIVDLVGSLTDDKPVLLVVEDVHWLDDSSLLVVEQLARRLADRPFTVLAATRPSRRPSILDAVASELTGAGLAHLELEPLHHAAVAQLATGVLGLPPGPNITAVLAGAAGNPFYVTALLAALVADELVDIAGGFAEIADPSPPPSLDPTILTRLGYLPPDSLDLLRIAAVLGTRFTVDDLAVVLHRSASDLLERLAQPLAAGLLEASDTALVFRHDLVRGAIYRDLPNPAARALHLQAAGRLADAGRPPGQVATHVLAGAEPGNRQAIDWLKRAADDVVARSPAIAATILEGAVALCGTEEPDLDELQVDLMVALTWSGRNKEASDLVVHLDGRPHTGPVADRLNLAAGRTLHLLGRDREALDRYEMVIGSPHIHERQQARVVADVASAHLMVGGIDDARRAAEDACERGRRIGDDPALCGGLSALSWIANVRGRTLEAVALGEQAIALATTSTDRETARRSPWGYQGVVLMDADRLEDGKRSFHHARRCAEVFGDSWLVPASVFGQMLADFYAGRLDDAEVSLDTARRAADDAGVHHLTVWGQSVAARVAIRRGDLALASGLLGSADEEVERFGPRVGVDWLLWCRALLQEAEGDPARAAATLREAWELVADFGLISQGRLIGPDLVRVLLATDDLDKAEEVVGGLEVAAELGGIDGTRAVALRCRGLVQGQPEVLLQAVDLLRRSPRSLDLADTLRDAAPCLIGADRGIEARPLLEEALGLYDVAGATRDHHGVQATLRTLGVSAGARGGRSRPRFGWAALTATEVEVAKLAAEGLSNPEIARRRFVSPRTIESHLSNAFTKLGLTSRVGLTAEVVRRLG